MASDEKLFSDKDIAKIGLSVGVDALLKNETEVFDNEKYRLYVKYQQFEGKITKEEADKQIKDIRDNKYLDVDDANAWVASTVASGENIYKVKGYRIDELDNEVINSSGDLSKNTESKDGSGISAIKKWAESKVKEQSLKSDDYVNHEFDTRDNDLIKKNIDTEKMARQLGIDESHIINDLNMTELEKQQNVYLKTDLSDKKTITKIDNRRLDDIVDKDTREFCEGVTITGNKGKVDVQSEYLGNFTYDPKEFALGYKEISEKNGSKSKLPVLEYIAGDEGEKLWDFDGADKGLWRAGVSSIKIPDGLKNMDYMFANQEQLRYMPEIPKSVTSAHYSFANCKNMYVPQNVATEHGENWNIGDAVWHTNYRVKLPDGLEDMSGMFKNSTQFRANFEKLPVNLKNGTDAFKGCEELGGRETHLWGLIGQDLKAPQFGTDITPYLTSQYAKDIMGDISNEKVKQYGDNTDFYINKDGTFNTKYKDKIDYGIENNKFDKNAFDKSKSQTGLEHAEDVITGKTATEAEIASNGMRSQNKVYNAETKSFEYDESGELASDSKPKSSLWQRIVIDAAVGVGGYSITKGLTGSKVAGLLVGVGGTALLDYIDVLPESLSPVFKGVAGMMPDSPFKTKLVELADKLNPIGDKTISDQKKYFTKDRVSEAHAEDRLADSIKSMGTAGYMNDGSTKESMQNGGKAAAESGAFWAAAREGEDGKIVGAVKNKVIEFNTSNMQVYDSLPEADRKSSAKDYYKALFDGLKEYNIGAASGIKSYSNDITKQDMASEGLNMANRAYVEAAMESMSDFESKYNTKLFDDKELVSLSDGISGIGDLSNYKSNKFETQKEETATKLISLNELDKADYELDDYDEPEHTYQSRAEKRKETDESLSVDVSRKSEGYVSAKEDKTDVVKSDVEQSDANPDKKSESKYAKMAEDKFGDIVKSDADTLEYN